MVVHHNLTMVGYGDEYQNTPAGRVTAAFTVIFGLGVSGSFISVIGGTFLQAHGGSSAIRISPTCRERLMKHNLEQSENVNELARAKTVERFVADANSPAMPKQFAIRRFSKASGTSRLVS